MFPFSRHKLFKVHSSDAPLIYLRAKILFMYITFCTFLVQLRCCVKRRSKVVNFGTVVSTQWPQKWDCDSTVDDSDDHDATACRAVVLARPPSPSEFDDNNPFFV